MLVAGAYVGNLDIVKAEAQKQRGRFDKHVQLQAVYGLIALIFAHTLVPCRQHNGDDRHALELVVDVKLRSDAVFSEAVDYLEKFGLILERAPADKDGVGVLELEVCSLGYLHELIDRS